MDFFGLNIFLLRMFMRGDLPLLSFGVCVFLNAGMCARERELVADATSNS